MDDGIASRLDDRAVARLESDICAWLTTVRSDAQPQASIVWFLWDDGTIWVRSQPRTPKVRNLAAPAHVGFNLNSNEVGGDVVTLEAVAEIVGSMPQESVDSYVAKYDERIRESLGMTPAEMLAGYPVTIRLEVTRARAW